MRLYRSFFAYFLSSQKESSASHMATSSWYHASSRPAGQGLDVVRFETALQTIGVHLAASVEVSVVNSGVVCVEIGAALRREGGNQEQNWECDLFR